MLKNDKNMEFQTMDKNMNNFSRAIGSLIPELHYYF